MAIDELAQMAPADEDRPTGPAADQFPSYPISWYLFCDSKAIDRQPFSKSFLGHRLVAYRTSGGKAVVMDARCAHLGSDLGKGCVNGDDIVCPFHDWRYGPDGRCVGIPAQRGIPDFARQTAFPTEERNGLIYIFNAAKPIFPLPFFAEVRPDELVPAAPFGTVLDCPWYMAGANAFDLQHFNAAHDRRLKEPPIVSRPSPYAFQSSGKFDVSGDSLRDRLTRRFSGDEVTLALTDWCGSLSFATATFRRTSSYGMVAREPLPDGGVRVQVIVFVRRSQSAIARALRDPLSLAIRRYFIRKFLTEDAIRLQGVRYDPYSFIACDREMVHYFRFLTEVAHGKSLSALPGVIQRECELNKPK